ncbi:hypothetical protein GWN26_09365, partial [Candidatus Saccharibacteria bacterium]|nr:hypothetical protein [Candidatus Saccharibacteria bacterium]NIS38517.1 hypothetical protein [Candidatus Saccharibacteria bacterium]NIV03950.1 hypothetical protein [Calditrichia bacterium]NIV72320.1 hypothetical protein [Calditrichia bacterium]NIV99327.1 hypothetical protein [Candidatus Saccharibacteria bacterium]
KAVTDTKKNFEWLDEQGLTKNKIDLKLFQTDIKELDKYIEQNSIQTIVAEPFLGPPLKKEIKIDEIIKIKSDLEDLYVRSFQIFTKI